MNRTLPDRLPLALLSRLALLALACAGAPARGALGPENVLVVVNAASPDSVAIAEEYARLRRVPDCNIVRLTEVPSGTSIAIEEFRERILGPVMDAIRARGLQAQIDCVAYSAGFPYAVDVRGDIAGRALPRVITLPASLTGVTYFSPMVRSRDASYLALDANWYARRIAGPRREPAWTPDDLRLRTEMENLLQQAAEERRKAAVEKRIPPATSTEALEKARRIGLGLRASHEGSAELLYNLACASALLGRDDEAMEQLEAAVRAGWYNASLTRTDPDLATLRARPAFQALLTRMGSVVIRSQAPRPFRATTAWNSRGEADTSGAGRHYLLSVMLGYVGEKANTLEEVLACLRRSAAADGTRPRGTVYLMESTDQARTGPRAWSFPSVAKALEEMGVRAEVLKGVLPTGKPDVAGAVVGAASFAWPSSGSTILPGAFCEHLTSFAGVMKGGGQTLLSEWIRHGAAGSSGTVTEPYNTPAKFPSAFLHVYYAAGLSLAEAFYSSVPGPYQQLLVGDPLCQPWATAPRVQVAGLRDGQALRGALRITPSAVGGRPVQRYELYIDGRLRASAEPGRTLILDPAGLSPGVHEARVVALAGPLETRGRAILTFRVANSANR